MISSQSGSRVSRAESLLNKRAKTQGLLRPNKQAEAEAAQFIKDVKESVRQESAAARHAYSKAIKGDVWLRVSRSIAKRETLRKAPIYT